MKAGHTIRIALTGLGVNKMRSALTVLGVVIGVASVISLMSVGRGSQAVITNNIEAMGTNLLFISPGATSQEGVRGALGSAGTLTLEDAEAISDSTLASSVVAVAPQVNSFAQVVAGRQNTFTQVLGVTPEYQFVRNFPLAQGSFISASQVKSRARVVVLGSSVSETLFGLRSPIGELVKINGIQYEVIGVLKSKGGTGFGISDDIVLSPITTVQERLSFQRTVSGGHSVSSINIQVKSSADIDAATQQISAILRDRHNTVGADDFTITSQEDMIQTLRESTGVFVLLLAAIAGISLLVGGIGIMNIMLVSVTERTREIGIRKSVGARRQDILLQFLVESATLSLLGGGIGILVGWGISLLISGLGISGTSVHTVMSADILILAVSVSAAIGIVFGLYPAYRAARLNPIDALRYE